MNEDNHVPETIRERMEMSAAIATAGGMTMTPHVEHLLAPLISGEMTLKQHEAWLLQQLRDASNA